MFDSTPYLRPTIWVLALVTLLSGCEQRYWYRKKVRDSNLSSVRIKYPSKSIKVQIYNLSPEFISKSFEHQIELASMLELEKKGFRPSLNLKDTPNFNLVIFLRVDSYYVYGGFYNPSFVTKTKVNTSGKLIRQKNVVKELSFSYKMLLPKSGYLYWQTDDGLYFFNEENRDIKRSVGMVRYALSNVP